MWRRRKVFALIRNFLNATSTRRSTFGSSEGAPSKTLVLTESGASKNEEQAKCSEKKDYLPELQRPRSFEYQPLSGKRACLPKCRPGLWDCKEEGGGKRAKVGIWAILIRRHRRFKSFLENKIRHVRVNSKLAFYEKFQAQASKDGKGVISSLPKRNFVITSRKKKTKSQLRDPIRARCPFYARALFDFPTKHEEEMSLMKDALLCVRIVSPSKWCLAQDEEGNEGWVPINYIERVHPKLDANLAFKCAEAEVLGIEKQIDRVNQDGTALQKLEAQLKDLLTNKALASSRVMALGSMTTAVSSQERARLEVEKAKKDAKNEELVAKAEAWLSDADESVKEALEIVASGKGIAQAASAVSRAEKAALEAVNAAKEAVRESKATTGKDKQLLVKKAEKRLEHARGILLTLKRYEEALVERQEATQLILKHHEKNNSGQIDIKVAVARKKDANERASILKIAAARALEEMSASEEIFKISKTITALENKLAKAANKEEKSEIETEIISQKKQLASAQQRADAAERLRYALEKQAKAVVSVKEISIAAEGKTPKGETSTEELIQRRRHLEECVGATKKAAYEYEKVFGFNPLKEKEAGKEGGTSAFEGGEALAKLEAMIDSRSAPSRNGEFSFAEHHQLILDAIQSCSLFNQARLEGVRGPHHTYDRLPLLQIASIRLKKYANAHTRV
eukprot:jgi/Bigna1/80944/fgenesh1_pg.76_\